MLNGYKAQILAIAEKNGVTEDVARDMFVANMEKGARDGTYWYEGADSVDFAALKTEWDAMTDQQRSAEIESYEC